MGLKRSRLSWGVCALVLSCVPALGGCNGFFVCQKASCPASGTGTGSSSTNYGYVLNTSAGAQSISGYEVSSGALTASTNSPYALGYQPQSLVVLPGDSYLYVAADVQAGASGIFGYSIGTGGALTVLSSGASLALQNSVALDATPDGDYLFSLNSTYTTMEEYQIQSGGLLKDMGPFTTGFYTPQIAENASVKISPNNNFVAVAVAGQGTVVFPLSSGSITGNAQVLSGPTIGNYAIAIDSSNYLYVLNQAGLYLYPVSSAGVPSGGNTYPIGTSSSQPTAFSALTITTGNSYIYVASEGTIYGFSGVGSGTLAATSQVSVTGPASVSALGRDSSGGYLLAAGYSSSAGLQLFSIGTTGALTEVASVATGTTETVPNGIAFTH